MFSLKGDRGNFLLLLLFICLFLAQLFFNPLKGKLDTSPYYYREHVVLPGETLWTIAKRYFPNSDPRDGTFAIRRMNGLTPKLQEYQIIKIPVQL